MVKYIFGGEIKMEAYIGSEVLLKVLKTVKAHKNSYVLFGNKGLITLRYLKGV